jgi:hypothetical protein
MKRKTEQADAESPPRNYQNLAQNALCTSTRSALDFPSVLSMTAGCGHPRLLAGTQLYSPRAELSLVSSSLLDRWSFGWYGGPAQPCHSRDSCGD